MTKFRTGGAFTMMLIGFLFLPGAGRSQVVASDTCTGGSPSRPDLGITGMVCHCSSRTVDGVTLWQFRTEPEILGVRADGPSADLLQPGDRVVRIGGQLITTPAGGRAWSDVAPGDTVRLRVRRGRGITNVTFVAARSCPESPAENPAESPLPEVKSPRLTRLYPDGWLGLGLSCACSVDTSTGDPRWAFETSPTVVAVAPGSPASAAGVRPGDILIRIDQKRLTTPEGGAAFSALRPGQEIRFTFERDGEPVTLEMTAVSREDRWDDGREVAP